MQTNPFAFYGNNANNLGISSQGMAMMGGYPQYAGQPTAPLSSSSLNYGQPLSQQPSGGGFDAAGLLGGLGQMFGGANSGQQSSQAQTQGRQGGSLSPLYLLEAYAPSAMKRFTPMGLLG